MRTPDGAFAGGPPAMGVQTAFGRLPTGPFFTPLGEDTKRVLRSLRKGGLMSSNGPTARPFPLCMRRHLATLHSNRHLRHHARHQLTLFFKGLDMSAEEALAVWRNQIAHGRMTDFQREHTYHVRHAYGLEGKMADYPPHTCERLAKSQDAGDGPGCPFAGVAGVASRAVGTGGSGGSDGAAGMSDGGCGGGGGGGYSRASLELRAELARLVTLDDVENIAGAAEAGAPRAACARLFAALHGGGVSRPFGDGGGGGDAGHVQGCSAGSGGCGGDGGDGDGGGDGEPRRTPPPRTTAMTRTQFLVDAVAHLKFPHDYYDASVQLEATCRGGGGGGVVVDLAGGQTNGGGGGGGDGSAAPVPAIRRHIALELDQESSSDDEDNYGHL